MATTASARSAQSPFQLLSLHPLIGLLDSRSRPADIPPGGFRWKLNWQTTPDAKLCRRGGFEAFNPTGPGPVNQDLHHQGATRKPITFMFENTSSTGARQLFAGTEDTLFLLDASTGHFDPILTGWGAGGGGRWMAASLQDKVFFTNGVQPPVYYDVETGASPAEIPQLMSTGGGMTGIDAGAYIQSAKVIVEFSGFIILMNLTDSNGKRYPSKIAWSNLNNGLQWCAMTTSCGPVPDPVPDDITLTVASFEDLPYGDEILNAVPLLGSLYVFTRRGIWVMSPTSNATAAQVFAFQQRYSEPKNQAGCLAFPFTLVSTGQEIYYLAREAPYKFSPYAVAPEREDWLYRGSGAIYKMFDTMIDSQWCNLPVAEYSPTTRELWFSWPSFNANTANRGGDSESVLNNWSLVAQIDQKTCDMVDAGFSALVNFRETPLTGLCNEAQDLLGVSTRDNCIKNLGTVFYREFLEGSSVAGYDITVDPEETGIFYERKAYNSILRGLVPTGYLDREKLIRLFRIADDTSEENTPANLLIRMGMSYSIQDPSEGQSLTGTTAENVDGTCAVLWGDYQTKLLACSDSLTMKQMKDRNLKPAQGKDFPLHILARFLYFEVVIEALTSASAGDCCLMEISWDIQALPKF